MKQRLLPLLLVLTVAACGDDDETIVTDTSDTSSDASDVSDSSDTSEADTSPDTAVEDIQIDTPEPDAPTLDEVATEIFTGCSTPLCHSSRGVAGGLSLADDDGLLERLLGPSSVDGLNLVEPGSPEDSYLFLKITGDYVDVGGEGSRMPSGGRLSAADEQLVSDWITGLIVE